MGVSAATMILRIGKTNSELQLSTLRRLKLTAQFSRRLTGVAAFTLIELILLMALLAIVISLIAPRLASFFHGRLLDSEARQLLALSRHGQSRAVSEGIPMRLWLDARTKTYGLESEPGYNDVDTNAVQYSLSKSIQLEVASDLTASPMAETMEAGRGQRGSVPAFSFLPDGTIGENSPRTVVLRDQDGGTLTLAQTRSGLGYELRKSTEVSNESR